MSHKYCSHNYDVNRCPNTTCSHHDNRPLVQQLFGRGGSNSALAALTQRTNPELYKKTADEARLLGLLPQIKVPRCLQDPQ
jgi:hypothetical protein